MTAFNLTLKYGLFASAAIAINLSVQEISLRLYQGPYYIYSSILAGTLVGLVCKYWLDKHYIFIYITDSAKEDLHKFIAYSFTGVFTTALFWGFELGFHFWFGSKLARYSGAILGLTIGYVVKYRLDKRYVFKPQARL